jgi:DNA mismatch repair protein MutS2
VTEEFFQPKPSNILDLHNFRFEEVEPLLDEFIWSCMENGFKEGSIIHGKGTGAQRELVHRKLKSNANVLDFAIDGANWGKTIFKITQRS